MVLGGGFGLVLKGLTGSGRSTDSCLIIDIALLFSF